MYRYDLNDMCQTVSDIIYCIMFTSVSIVYTKEIHLKYEYKGYGPEELSVVFQNLSSKL